MEKEERVELILKMLIFTVIVSLFSAKFASDYTYEKYCETAQALKAELSEDEETSIDEISSSLISFRKVINQYFKGEEIDENKMLEATIKGYVSGLGDEYSEYFTKEEWEEFQADALGNYVGIGIYMSVNDAGNVIVLEPIKGTPAEAAGLKEGDIITEVNGENVLGMDSSEVASRIKGEEGTTVKVKVYRNDEYIEKEIIRKSIKVYHVEYEMLEDNIGYVQLVTFDEGCADEFRAAINDLEKQGAKKLILDVRSNTGGLVDEALEIAEIFCDKDEILLVTEDANNQKEYIKDEAKATSNFEQIVVLTNEYTASASEILAGILKENCEAVLVGKTTFGKGVIQTVFSLADGSALKLTIEEYFTPNENKINKEGIKPDHEIKLEEDENGNIIDTQLNKAKELLKN